MLLFCVPDLLLRCDCAVVSVLFVLQLILNEKGFLSQRKTTILHQGEGPIKNIKWKGSLIAWSNELVCYYYRSESVFSILETSVFEFHF